MDTLSRWRNTRRPRSGRSEAADADPVSIVRRAFAAFAARDLAAATELCHPEIVLHPHPNTTELTGRHEPYRGYGELLLYADDVAAVWKTLTVTPTVFRRGAGTVIVFGHADADSGSQPQSHDMLWVWRLRDGLVSSVDIFEAPGRVRADR